MRMSDGVRDLQHERRRSAIAVPVACSRRRSARRQRIRARDRPAPEVEPGVVDARECSGGPGLPGCRVRAHPFGEPTRPAERGSFNATWRFKPPSARSQPHVGPCRHAEFVQQPVWTDDDASSVRVAGSFAG